MDPVILYIILGAIAGLIHQLSIPFAENNVQNFVRGVIVGAVAPYIMSYLVVINPALAFIYGWFGDSVIANIIKQYQDLTS